MAKPARSVIIHSLEHALAAACAAESAGRPVRIISAPGAAGYAGPAWFAEVVAAARRAHPGAAIEAVLDCADRPGDVLAALRRGIAVVRFDGPAVLRRKLAAIAAAQGARLDRRARQDAGRAAALDLDSAADPQEACRAWLSE